MLIFQGCGKTNLGELQILALAAADALPAGTTFKEGLACSSGYLVVVIS